MTRKTDSSAERVARGVLQQLESLQRAGVTHLPRPRRVGTAHRTNDAAPAVVDEPRGSGTAHRTNSGAPGSSRSEAPDETPSSMGGECPHGPLPQDAREAALAVIARKVARCTRCAELVRNRTQTVFGVGDPNARLAFLGEAPGADEDREGVPFVGRAGQLLTDIIVKGMKIRREDVYILNILRCRPPDNRRPNPDEAANCREFLDGQFSIIRPQFICCLGASAAQFLLGTEVPIGQSRGRFYEYQGAQVICTYHPAYLLRTPSAKRQVWEDLQLLMTAMGLPK